MDFLSCLSGQRSHPLDINPAPRALDLSPHGIRRFYPGFCVTAGMAALGSAVSNVSFSLECSIFRWNFYPEDCLGYIQEGFKLFIFSLNPFCGVSDPALILTLGFLTDISVRVSTGIRSSHVLCVNISRFISVPLLELLGIYPR